MNTTTHPELASLCVDLRELIETNCHGEALEKIAEFFDDKRLLKAFEAINTLHNTIGFLDTPLAELRQNFSAMLFARIESKHGASARRAICNCL